jgi:putative phage-type endonuclease
MQTLEIALSPSASHGVPINDGNRDWWYQQRRTGIGASEVWRVVGDEPGAKVDLWLHKRDPDAWPMTIDEEMAYWGHAHEATLLGRYARDHGPYLAREVFYRSQSHPFLFATVDALGIGELIECKTLGRGSRVVVTDDPDDLPERWYWQAQFQMFCADHPGPVRFMVLTDMHSHTECVVERSDEHIGYALPHLEEFWALVQSGEAPDLGEASVRAIQAVYPPRDEEFVAGDDVLTAVKALDEVNALIRQGEANRDAIKASILLAMQGRTAILEDGRWAEVKTVTRPEHTVKASSFQQLYISKPRSA